MDSKDLFQMCLDIQRVYMAGIKEGKRLSELAEQIKPQKDH